MSWFNRWLWPSDDIGEDRALSGSESYFHDVSIGLAGGTSSPQATAAVEFGLGMIWRAFLRAEPTAPIPGVDSAMLAFMAVHAVGSGNTVLRIEVNRRTGRFSLIPASATSKLWETSVLPRGYIAWSISDRRANRQSKTPLGPASSTSVTSQAPLRHGWGYPRWPGLASRRRSWRTSSAAWALTPKLKRAGSCPSLMVYHEIGCKEALASGSGHRRGLSERH